MASINPAVAGPETDNVSVHSKSSKSGHSRHGRLSGSAPDPDPDPASDRARASTSDDRDPPSYNQNKQQDDLKPPESDGDAARDRGSSSRRRRHDDHDDASKHNESSTSKQQPRTTKFRFKSKDSKYSRSSRRHRTGSRRDDEEGLDRGENDDYDERHRSHRHRHHTHSPNERNAEEGGPRSKKSSARERSRSRSRARHDRSRSRSRSRSRRRHHHRRHRRKHHHHSTKEAEDHEPKPSNYDPFAPDVDQQLDPDAAFRESLFDAMADDEGAAYWEGVYGQPIHVYSAERVGPTGDLERMTEEEYAAHVRQKMWEKTHAGLLEERARREREKEEERRKQDEGRRIAKEMERSLRKGEERRRKRVWRDRWEEYVKRWERWLSAEGNGGGVGTENQTGASSDLNGTAMVERIPWPWPVIEKRKQAKDAAKDPGDDEYGPQQPTRLEEEDADAATEVDPEMVRTFFVNGIGLEDVGEKEFAARLKEERVRWHPDRIQKRLGGGAVDASSAAAMRDVTAIFQVVDALWNDTRKNLA